MFAAHFSRWLVGFLSCCLLPVLGHGVQDEHPLGGFVLTKWTQKDGLPGSDVRRITQTPDGYLWLSTEAGLIRFDGIRFTSIPTVPEMPAPATGGLLAAADGSLWVGLVRGGIVHMRGEAGTYYPPDKALISGQVRTIFQDHIGAVWVGTSSGLSRFLGNQWRIFGTQDGFPGHRVGSIIEDHAGVLRIASDLGVFRWEESTSRFVSEPEGRTYTGTLSEDTHGTIWVADEAQGLRTLHAVDRDTIQWKSGVGVFEDHRHNLWVRSYVDGLRRISAQGQRERFTVREGLSNSFVECVFEDHEGNLWIGTQNGLNRLRPTGFVAVPDQNIADGFARDITATRDGSLWAMVNPRIYRLRNGVVAAVPAPFQFQGTAFSADGADPLLVASTHYLAQLRGNRLVPLNLPNNVSFGLISDVARDHDGGVWLADYSAGLVRWSHGNITQYPQLSRKNVRRIVVDQRGQVWAGAADGLWKMEDNVWRHFTKADGALEGAIRALYLGPTGTLWAATANGITRFKDEHFISFFPALPPGGISSVVEDSQGALWLVHSAGIIQITAAEWERAAREQKYQMQYRQFDEEDGLPAPPPAIQGHFGVRERDGKLWFALRSGVVSIDPTHMEENHVPPPVVIEQVVANHRRLLPAPSLRLPPTRSLEIDYTALSLAAPQRVKFKIKLEGFDNDWIDPGVLRQVFYTNLAPGNYRFRVMACNNDGIWNEAGAILAFSVAPAFYQTRWFLALCVLCGIGILGGAYWLRLRQLNARSRAMIEERVAERMRLARELHDTLLQNVTGLSLQIDGLSKAADAAPVKSQLDELRRQAEGCVREALQSVWDLRSRSNGHHDLVAQLRNSGERLTCGKPVQFILSVQGRPRPLARDIEQQILRIGQEAISNSVRHACAKEVLAHLGFEDRVVRLRVSDDGRGFDPNDVALCNGRWGLITMRERAQQIGADFRIASRPQGGTEIETTVLLPNV